DRKRAAFASQPLVKALGFAPLLDAVQLTVQGEVLDARLELAAADVPRVFSAIRQAWSPAPLPRPAPLPMTSGTAVAPHADEVLGARDAGDARAR
ncbi:MAG TPA: hypothetical protein VF316_12320, partial [Polyangiaceae bacterium]